MRRIDGIAELGRFVGGELGASDWLVVDQGLIERFAEVTGDRQWLHTDPARAATGPYRGTIAHGLLILSLLPALAAQVYEITGVVARINYGYDRVRFPQAVPVGSRVRDRVLVRELVAVDTGTRAHLVHTVELEGADRPACVAESIVHLVGIAA